MLNIVKCPLCDTRVVPSSTGECPACRKTINRVQAKSRPSAEEGRERVNVEGNQLAVENSTDQESELESARVVGELDDDVEFVESEYRRKIESPEGFAAQPAPVLLSEFIVRWTVLIACGVFAFAGLSVINYFAWSPIDHGATGISVVLSWGMRLVLGPAFVLGVALLCWVVFFYEREIFVVANRSRSDKPECVTQELLDWLERIELNEFLAGFFSQRELLLRVIEVQYGKLGIFADLAFVRCEVKRLQIEWERINRTVRSVDPTTGKDHMASLRRKLLARIVASYNALIRSLPRPAVRSRPH